MSDCVKERRGEREEGCISLFTYGACVDSRACLFLPVLCASTPKGGKKKGKKKRNRNRREEIDDWSSNDSGYYCRRSVCCCCCCCSSFVGCRAAGLAAVPARLARHGAFHSLFIKIIDRYRLLLILDICVGSQRLLIAAGHEVLAQFFNDRCGLLRLYGVLV